MLSFMGETCPEMRSLSDTFARLSQKKDKKASTRASAASQAAYWAEQARQCEAATVIAPITPPPSVPNVSVTVYNSYGQPVVLSVQVDATGNPVIPMGYTLVPPGTPPLVSDIFPNQQPQPMFAPNTQQTMTLINTYGQAVTLTVTIDQNGNALLPMGYTFMPQAGTGTQYGMLPTGQPPQYFQMQSQSGPVMTPIDEMDPAMLPESSKAAAPKETGALGGFNMKTLLLLGAGGALIWYIMKHQRARK